MYLTPRELEGINSTSTSASLSMTSWSLKEGQGTSIPGALPAFLTAV